MDDGGSLSVFKTWCRPHPYYFSKIIHSLSCQGQNWVRQIFYELNKRYRISEDFQHLQDVLHFKKSVEFTLESRKFERYFFINPADCYLKGFSSKSE